MWLGKSWKKEQAYNKCMANKASFHLGGVLPFKNMGINVKSTLNGQYQFGKQLENSHLELPLAKIVISISDPDQVLLEISF